MAIIFSVYHQSVNQKIGFYDMMFNFMLHCSWKFFTIRFKYFIGYVNRGRNEKILQYEIIFSSADVGYDDNLNFWCEIKCTLGYVFEDFQKEIVFWYRDFKNNIEMIKYFLECTHHPLFSSSIHINLTYLSSQITITVIMENYLVTLRQLQSEQTFDSALNRSQYATTHITRNRLKVTTVYWLTTEHTMEICL